MGIASLICFLLTFKSYVVPMGGLCSWRGGRGMGLVDLFWSTNYSSSKKTIFAINMSFNQFLHIFYQNWIWHWIPHIWKPTKAHFIQVSTLFSQKDMNINTFQPVVGGHLGFLNFKALSAIFELGIHQIWVQHPSIPLKSLYSIN